MASYLSVLKPGIKQSLTDVLRKLPLHGVGCRVARDTWAPESGRYWDIAHVMTRKDDLTKLDAWGYLHYKDVQRNATPKRIASVWKYGWFWKLRPTEELAMQAQLQRMQSMGPSLPGAAEAASTEASAAVAEIAETAARIAARGKAGKKAKLKKKK
ncbi:MAG: hypothetical protein WDW38_006122 [Sanguina aurantia]